MLTMRRAFKNIWRRRFRTLLVSLVLALCVAVFVSTIAGVDASEDATAEMLEEYGQAAQATIEETQLSMTAITVGNMGRFMPGLGDGVSEDEMSEEVAYEISAMDGVAAVIPTVSGGFGEAEGSVGGGGFGDGGGFVRGGFGLRNAYMIYGVPIDSTLDEQYSTLPITIVDGRSLVEGDDYAVLIGDELTDYFKADVGDTIEIEGTYFKATIP